MIRGKNLLASATVALVLCGLPAQAAFAAPGELDAGFGNGGKAIVDFGGSDAGSGLALQADGRIVVGGTGGNPGSYDFAVARLLRGGGLDGSFGAGGKALANLGGGFDIARDLALQPDGGIVMAGYSDASAETNNDLAVARLLNPQGTLDPSFGAGGSSLAPIGSNSDDFGGAVALQPDGRIVTAGSSNASGLSYDFVVTRIVNPQGTFDGGFGIGGKSLADISGGSKDFASDVALQSDGRILVSGSGGTDAAVIRILNPSGNFDPSFGAGTGKRVLDFGGNDNASAIAMQPDGKIVLAGSNGSDFVVTRLLSNGNTDNSFGLAGRATVDFGGVDYANAIALQPDGKVLVAGFREGDRLFALSRLQPNGTLDTTFGSDGKTVVDFGGGNDVPNEILVQPDGGILLAGSTNAGGNTNFALVRVQGDPGGSKVRRCAGKKATVAGTDAKDKLKGTKRKDVIAALGGKDTVKGLKGNDVICGGKGKDKLLGGPGKDKLLGQAGKDSLKGGPGRDKVKGGPGKDTETP